MLFIQLCNSVVQQKGANISAALSEQKADTKEFQPRLILHELNLTLII